MNIELLEEIKKSIRTDQNRFDMQSMCYYDNTICKTVGCIAGWACFLSGYTYNDTLSKGFDIEAKAREVLDIPYKSKSVCGNPLFYVREWPQDLAEEFMEAEEEGDRNREVEIACKAIDRYIAGEFSE